MIVLHRHRLTVDGFEVTVDDDLGHLSVAHDGTITWDQLQAVKNAVWGPEARAIEVYPRQGEVVNSGNWRHLGGSAGPTSAPTCCTIPPADPASTAWRPATPLPGARRGRCSVSDKIVVRARISKEELRAALDQTFEDRACLLFFLIGASARA